MTTPLLFRTTQGFEWPEGERVFYVLGSDGLFICREHEFFRSCAPARTGPGDLERQESFLVPSFPVIPQADFERVVGFFDLVGAVHGGEAAVTFHWDREEERVRTVVPEQTATVVRYQDGYRSAIGLHYEPPTKLPPHWVPFGDAHSHVHMSAYCSHTDKEDESYDAGLHLVVGRIGKEPPQFHVDAVADGTRFELELEDVVAGYETRRHDFPPEWMDRVHVDVSWSTWGTTQGYSSISSLNPST